MDDQHNLIDYYEGVLQTVALHLIDKHKAETVNPSEYDTKQFSGSFKVKQGNHMIILSIPYHFPDEFPTILIPQPYFSNIYPIPHLNKHQVLCTFDPVESHPNAENPVGVIDEVIKRAFYLINSGVKGLNSSDYLDEFESYWWQEASSRILTLIDFPKEPQEMYLISFSHPTWDASLLATNSLFDGIQWLKQAGATTDGEYRKALYLPLLSIGQPPFPATNGELIQRLRTTSPEALKPLITFLDRNPRHSTVLFSIPSSKGNILGAWEHNEAQKIKLNAHKSKRITQKGLKGFRAGHKNAFLELQRDFRDVSISTHMIVQVDKERLLTRGGDGSLIEDTRIGIVGCGSIGSHVAKSVSDMGIHRMLLVDKDILTFENIARHLCGAVDVGKNKVDALHGHLASHLPHSENTTYNGDVLTILRDYQSLLDQCDFTIVAVGHLPTELRLNDLQRKGNIAKPILYVWVEPYLAGAHAAFIHPGYIGCLKCLFDEQHAFKQNVLENPGQYSIREAGCQSAFVPYNVLEVKRFIHHLMFFIQDILTGKINENLLFTWIGDLTIQKMNGRRIAGRWAAAENYITRRVTLRNFQGCEVCSSASLQIR
ncbi:ThiF family adenylyltransferase [Brevibacillus sp. NPDC003359]|uniref:ThiF family adenylyltransferase n=1 Tax=unclassified Brevibacillus TaxID=2684853 RepID=UPI0036940273